MDDVRKMAHGVLQDIAKRIGRLAVDMECAKTQEEKLAVEEAADKLAGLYRAAMNCVRSEEARC